jgi:hypothetical protein
MMEGKKHFSQMTELEREFLLREFFKIPPQAWSFTDYSFKRFKQRGIDPVHFMTLWKNPSLIEYHRKNGANRILLRSNIPRKGYEVCAVFDLTNIKIVTVWLNWVGNKHQNLVIEAYNFKDDIMEVFRSA